MMSNVSQVVDISVDTSVRATVALLKKTRVEAKNGLRFLEKAHCAIDDTGSLYGNTLASTADRTRAFRMIRTVCWTLKQASDGILKSCASLSEPLKDIIGNSIYGLAYVLRYKTVRQTDQPMCKRDQ